MLGQFDVKLISICVGMLTLLLYKFYRQQVGATPTKNSVSSLEIPLAAREDESPKITKKIKPNIEVEYIPPTPTFMREPVFGQAENLDQPKPNKKKLLEFEPYFQEDKHKKLDNFKQRMDQRLKKQFKVEQKLQGYEDNASILLEQKLREITGQQEDELPKPNNNMLEVSFSIQAPYQAQPFSPAKLASPILQDALMTNQFSSHKQDNQDMVSPQSQLGITQKTFDFRNEEQGEGKTPIKRMKKTSSQQMFNIKEDDEQVIIAKPQRSLFEQQQNIEDANIPKKQGLFDQPSMFPKQVDNPDTKNIGMFSNLIVQKNEKPLETEPPKLISTFTGQNLFQQSLQEQNVNKPLGLGLFSNQQQSSTSNLFGNLLNMQQQVPQTNPTKPGGLFSTFQ